GFLRPGDERSNHGVLRRGMVAKFSEYLRFASFDFGIPRWIDSFQHGDQRRWPDRNAGDLDYGFWAFVLCLRRSAGAIPARSVPVWNCARNHWQLNRPANRSVGGVVHLADPRAGLAVRGCLLPRRYASRVDARHLAPSPALLRLRKYARHSGRQIN